ncbi:hypothetical protein ACFP51_23355 [Streptomyces pratens]|uniref:ABC transporter permease n=1 Tax=Streptomyces pratens TaxID=887456 RepID=A0ABW1MC21_9ACTN
MGGVGTLPAPGLEQAGLHQAVQHQPKQLAGGALLTEVLYLSLPLLLLWAAATATVVSRRAR